MIQRSDMKGVGHMSVQPVGSVAQQPQQPQQTQQVQQPQQIQHQEKPVEKLEFKPMKVTPGYEAVETAEGTKALSEEALKKNIENLNRLLSARQTNITMEYDNLSSPKIVNIIDAQSGEVIKQIPPEGVVEIAMKARDYVLGLMIDRKA